MPATALQHLLDGWTEWACKPEIWKHVLPNEPLICSIWHNTIIYYLSRSRWINIYAGKYCSGISQKQFNVGDHKVNKVTIIPYLSEAWTWHILESFSNVHSCHKVDQYKFQSWFSSHRPTSTLHAILTALIEMHENWERVACMHAVDWLYPIDRW